MNEKQTINWNVLEHCVGSGGFLNSKYAQQSRQEKQQERNNVEQRQGKADEVGGLSI